MALRPLVCLGLLLSLSLACADEQQQDGPFPDARSYVHLVDGLDPPGEAPCPPQCNHRVVFCPDGTAELSFTDELIDGTYERDGDEVVLLISRPSPTLDSIVFTLSDGGMTARDDYQDQVWEAYSGPGDGTYLCR